MDNCMPSCDENYELRRQLDDLQSQSELKEAALVQASVKHQVDIVKLRCENNKLQAALQKANDDKECTHAELEAAHCQLAEARLQLNRLTVENNDLKRRTQELAAVRTKCQMFAEQLQQCQNCLAAAENQVKMCIASIAELNCRLETLQQELDDKRNAVTCLQAKYDAEHEENIRLRENVEQLHQRLCAANQELAAAREASSQRIASDDVLCKLQSTLRAVEADCQQAKSEADKQIASLSECVSRLQQQLKSCECEKATLQDQVQRLQDQTASLQRRLVAANDAQQRLLEQLQHLKEEGRQLKHQLDPLEECRAELNALAGIREQLLAKTAECEQLAACNEELKSRLYKCDQHNQQLRDETNKVNLLQADLDQMKTEQCTLEKTIVALKADNQHLQEKVDSLGSGPPVTACRDESADYKSLWQDEVESRSQLGLQMKRIEKCVCEANQRAETERRKVMCLRQQKQQIESQLECERKRNAELCRMVRALKAQSGCSPATVRYAPPCVNCEEVLNQTPTSCCSSDTGNEPTSNPVDCSQQMKSIERSCSEANDRAEAKAAAAAAADEARTHSAECRAQLAKTQRCYRKKLDEMNARLQQQAVERQMLDQRRTACFERLQYESCMIRNKLQTEVSSLRDTINELEAGKASVQQQLQYYQRLYSQQVDAGNELRRQLQNSKQTVATTATANSGTPKPSPVCDQYGDGRTDYAPASFNCPPNAADLPQSRDNETLNVIIRKQLDNIISRHVPKGAVVDQTSMQHRQTFTCKDNLTNEPPSQYMALIHKNYLL